MSLMLSLLMINTDFDNRFIWFVKIDKSEDNSKQYHTYLEVILCSSMQIFHAVLP